MCRSWFSTFGTCSKCSARCFGPCGPGRYASRTSAKCESCIYRSCNFSVCRCSARFALCAPTNCEPAVLQFSVYPFCYFATFVGAVIAQRAALAPAAPAATQAAPPPLVQSLLTYIVSHFFPYKFTTFHYFSSLLKHNCITCACAATAQHVASAPAAPAAMQAAPPPSMGPAILTDKSF
jgi:hypothetical protein